MRTKRFTLAMMLLLILGSSPIFAQFKQIELGENTGEEIKVKPLFIPEIDETSPKKGVDIEVLEQLNFSDIQHSIFPIARDGSQAIAFRGYKNVQKGLSTADQVDIYLKEIFKINNTRGELSYKIMKTSVDEMGMTHILVQQLANGIEIEGAEIKLHATDDIINYANGRINDVPFINPTAKLSSAAALAIVYDAYREKGIYKEITAKQKFLVPANHEESVLVYRAEGDSHRLVYRVKAYANVQQQFTYYIDAQTGEILETFKNFCTLHNHSCMPPDGPATATAKDLANVDRTINTYEAGGTFYMIDASRDMFNASASSMPNEPVGVIWTIDGQNTNPQNNNFDYDHVKSSDNNWASKIAVSAHYNGGEAFSYFKETHNRNSINNEGGNIISLINISDPQTGGGFDNAFWNGAALFYGNGNQAFTPLAEGLDVAGHEMSHGVVQATANLTYQGESGALNEAFADIFGAMIDRDDWLIGEDIVKTSAFPSGAMRDMSDPHNGGNSLNDPGYQPKNVSEQYKGSADNGGVHINSGIVNHAYYLFAETAGVGKERAEKVFYRALTNYLTKSSNFKDMRAAAEKAAGDLYNQAVVDAASSAFSAVGIGQGGGTTDYETEVEMNPGDDFLLSSTSNLGQIRLRNNNLELIGDPLVNVSHISKPSVTDNGQAIFFVGQDKNIYAININWDTGDVSGDVFDDQGVWRNVVVSKDGERIAVLTDQTTNQIIVFELQSGQQKNFTLYNPTFSDGVSTGDVDFADAMEFDFSGEWLMYDAQSTIQGGSNGSISYWDIGFLNVRDNSTGGFADGQIQKLFSQLPENTSVGNPSFSKNSPHIIAFDLIQNSDYSVMAANIEANEVNELYANGKLGYPNFNNSDSQIVYEASGNFGNRIGLSELEDDKITAKFNSHVEIVDDERLPVVFSNGERVISSTEEGEEILEFTVSPNPARDYVNIAWDYGMIQKVEIYSVEGRLVTAQEFSSRSVTISTEGLESGVYTIKVSGEQGESVQQLIKQ